MNTKHVVFSRQTVREMPSLLHDFRSFLQQQGFDICKEDGTGYASTVEYSSIETLMERYVAEIEAGDR